MIPVRLIVRNFMCYRDSVPPLSFEGIHLACLSGDNGNGKSALIDAMTWALWGQTRARSDDELIYSGQAEMEVEFDFRVREQLYRIIRRHSRPKRRTGSGPTIVEFQMATGDTFKSISGDGITQTQRKVIDVLHMDYDTFVNSAYLRQGHADEFTSQPPIKRKEVLANILGLSVYDELGERARELARAQEDEQARLEREIKEIIDELGSKAACEAELTQAQAGLATIETQRAAKETELNGWRRQKESLQRQQAQMEQLRAHISDSLGQAGLWEAQVKQHRSRWQEYEALLAERAAIDAGYARYTGAKRLSDDLHEKSQQSIRLERQVSLLESKIKEAKNELIKGHAVLQSRVDELTARAQLLPALKNQLQQAQWQQLTAREEAVLQKRQSAEAIQAEVNYLESDQARLEREVKEIAEKLALLAAHAEAKCPLCEQELSQERLKLIESKYTADKQARLESLRHDRSALTAKAAELVSLKKALAQLEASLGQEKAAAQGRISLVKKGMAEAEEAMKQLAEVEAKKTDIEQSLARQDFARAEQEALGRVERERAGLDYSPEQHEQVRQELVGLEPFHSRHQKLEEAEKHLAEEKAAVASGEEAAAKLREGIEADKQKVLALGGELEALPKILAGLAQAESEFQALDAARNRAREAVWGINAKLERCVTLEAKKKDKEGQLGGVAKQQDIYKELAEAFGKKGLQAMLIDEMALPEIEAEANLLLGRMTDNRMHVAFETQRPTKKGSVVETLDIKIADELGTRDYEMFSGGEAFRINFAIRIALSKLLARRAGAPLRTLIIDEGFGTQDATGIEKLKEAINSIQDDFDKILVVTHIEELRDAFPTRIDVTKTAQGSTISVN